MSGFGSSRRRNTQFRGLGGKLKLDPLSRKRTFSFARQLVAAARACAGTEIQLGPCRYTWAALKPSLLPSSSLDHTSLRACKWSSDRAAPPAGALPSREPDL